MPREPNRLRQKLAERNVAVGSAVFSWSPNMMEIAGYAGLDFMRIDTEHAWRRDTDIEHLIRAATVAGVVPILRIDGGDPHLPMKAFEIGAGGIIATEVDTVEAAQALVRAAKFPPVGERGYSGNCWSGGWGTRAGGEWVEWSDAELLVGIMAESPAAMDRIDDIMAVDGIDFALFGPADFSMALGLRKPAKNDARVQEALQTTVAAAKRSGKHVMYNPGTKADEITSCLELGVTMLEIGNDLGIARAAWAKAVQTVSPFIEKVE